MKKPLNTTVEVQKDPLEFLFLAMGLGASGAIELQESNGQKDLVSSDTLPSRIDQTCRGKLEEWGVEFIGPVEGDPLFQYVKLPEGWKKVPTEHSMWSHLVDEQGTKRAAIFYKAAFYDRDAFVSIEP